jgi:hypothetical protein
MPDTNLESKNNNKKRHVSVEIFETTTYLQTLEIPVFPDPVHYPLPGVRIDRSLLLYSHRRIAHSSILQLSRPRGCEQRVALSTQPLIDPRRVPCFFDPFERLGIQDVFHANQNPLPSPHPVIVMVVATTLPTSRASILGRNSQSSSESLLDFPANVIAKALVQRSG